MTKRLLRAVVLGGLVLGLAGCPTPNDDSPEPEPKSSDATLKSLTVSGGTLSPAFAPETTAYALTVETGVTSVTVTGVANHEGAAVTGGGEKTLVAGKNTVTLVVTAEDGNAGVYTLTANLGGETYAALNPVDLLDLSSLVAAPAKDAAPAVTVTETVQYTGTVSWEVRDGPGFSGFSGVAFGAGAVYRALISLVPKAGYTFLGTGADSFTYSGAAALGNAAGSGTISVTFRPTETGDGTYAFATPARYRELVPVNTSDLVITGDAAAGAFITGRTVTLTPYRIAKYETTWELWKEVYDWATDSAARGSGVYTIASPGTEGHGTTGTGTNANITERSTRPVATITWRDAIVWCNAYSEMSGLTPVYYTDAGYTTVLRASTITTGTTTPADTAKIKTSANGYRLPTEAQWEAAARGGNPSNTANWAYPYAGSDAIGGVAWYRDNAGSTVTTSSPDFGIHPVGKQTANLLGLFDMSGNAQEYVWDWSGSINNSETITDPTGASTGTTRVVKGGNYSVVAANCAVTFRGSSVSPISKTVTSGFRLAQAGN
jgi:formylglycine-generating enzyme required for sulfatase activity